MARFFFHLIGRTVERDEVGTELPSTASAKREGCKLIGTLVAEGLLDREGGFVALQVTDERGTALARLEVTAHEAEADDAVPRLMRSVLRHP